jgi:hypothetical protein
MPENPTYKALILENLMLAEDIGYLLEDEAKEKYKIKIKTDISPNFKTRIPQDYDIYFLHLSQINLRDLEDLRKEQPWSYILGMSGGGKQITNDFEIKKFCDSLSYIMNKNAIITAIENAIQKRTPNKP